MQEPDFLNEMAIESERRLPDQIYGERALVKLLVFPRTTKTWTFTLLSTFLNELSDFSKPSRRGFVATRKENRPHGTFVFIHKDIPKYFIKVKVTSEIEVQASTKWLINKWTKNYIIESSPLRKDGKTRVQPIMQMLNFFSLKFESISDGTKCLYSHSPLMYCSVYDFSGILHFFIKHVFDIGIPSNIDTCSIYEYNNTFISRSKKSINSLDELKKTIHGFLSLDIQESSYKRNLETIFHNGKTFYITGGIYISPFAQSILKAGDLVKGLLLDTTWKVMPLYVTSILMASSMNIGIPLGFAFGNSEDKTLYERHFKAFSEKTGIKLGSYVIESDQGSALKAICDENFAVHLACLRHLLVSLHYSPYSYAASELLKCSSLFELNNALTVFSDCFAKITEESELCALNNVLNKIGMNFAEKSLNLVDQKRWDQVSMLSRINFRMPSTTNSLESTHGHLNKRTPRHNGFWASINRLCESFILKNNLLNKRIQHNYAYLKATTLKKQKSVDHETMQSQQAFYSTRVDHCNCGENKLVAAILGIDIPCSHRLALGATFQQCPTLNIQTKEQWTELVIDINELPAVHTAQASDAKQGKLMYAVNIIRRFSCYSKRDEIEKFVIDNYNDIEDKFFVSGKEVSIIELIYHGISVFTEKRAEKKQEKINIKNVRK